MPFEWYVKNSFQFIGAHGFAGSAVAFTAGAVLSLSFAPFGWWPLAIACPALLMWLWQGASPRRAAVLGFWFNFGTFAVGTY